MMWFKIASASVLAAGLLAGASSAQAQSNYPYCLRTAGDASECTFQTLAQCEATRLGEGSFCERNPAFTPLPRAPTVRQ
jgi:Protein of unknown function (DUF3551)